MKLGIRRIGIVVAIAATAGLCIVNSSDGTASAMPVRPHSAVMPSTVTLHHGTWWRRNCKPHLSHKSVKSRRLTPVRRGHVTPQMWRDRRRDERLFLRCAYGYSPRLATRVVAALKRRPIPTVQQYRTYSIGVPGEKLPAAPGKPYHPSCTSKCTVAPSTTDAPMTDTPHNGTDCQRSYDHNASSWWNEELYSCLHYSSVEVSNGPSYFVNAYVKETVFKSFWGFGDVDDGNLNYGNHDPTAAHYPWYTHKAPYGIYPWVEAHTIRVFSTVVHVSYKGAGSTLVPTWYVCGNPRVYANGYETNDGTACYVH